MPMVAPTDTQHAFGTSRTAIELTLLDYFLTFFLISAVESLVESINSRARACYSDGALHTIDTAKENAG